MQTQQLKGTVTVNRKRFGIVTLPIDGEEVGAIMQLGKVAGQGAKVIGFFTEVHPFDTDRFSVWVNKAGRIIVSSEAIVRVSVGEHKDGLKSRLKAFFAKPHPTKVTTSPKSLTSAYQSWRTSQLVG
jgi:hypothetical protein